MAHECALLAAVSTFSHEMVYEIKGQETIPDANPSDSAEVTHMGGVGLLSSL